VDVCERVRVEHDEVRRLARNHIDSKRRDVRVVEGARLEIDSARAC
jgi:hypothetical protein